MRRSNAQVKRAIDRLAKRYPYAWEQDEDGRVWFCNVIREMVQIAPGFYALRRVNRRVDTVNELGKLRRIHKQRLARGEVNARKRLLRARALKAQRHKKGQDDWTERMQDLAQWAYDAYTNKPRIVVGGP